MKKHILFLCLALIGFGACDFPPNLSKDFSRPKPPVAITVIDEEKVALAETVLWAKPVKIVFKRDIFKPLIAAKSALSGFTQVAEPESDISLLVLSGTIASEKPVAFIRNVKEEKNYVVREQEFVNAFQVIKIDSKGVKLQKDGKDFYLKIPEAKK